MRFPRGSWLLAACAFTISAVLLSPAAVHADEQPRTRPRPAPDFFFSEPRVLAGARGQFVFPRAGSDLFDFFTDHLTLDKGDFRAGGWGAELAVRVAPRLEAVVGYDQSRSTRDSEYRDFVDNLFLPIEQTTRLETHSLTAGVRLLVAPRGRRVSQLAWVPNTITPHVGAGGGWMRYTLLQNGDFVDFVDLSVFRSVFNSSQSAASAYVSGGVDARLYRRLYLTTEGRYVWSAAGLDRDFVGFEPLDLSGLRFSAGISILF